MIYTLGPIRKQILGLGLHEATFAARGFDTDTPARGRLEEVAKTVIYGYNAALEITGGEEDIVALTNRTKPELQGFLSEGLAMGLFARGRFSLGNSLAFWNFARRNGGQHEYMSYVGAGLAVGVFGSSYRKFIERACPLCGSLVLDGIGFYYAMFKTKRGIHQQYVPASIARDRFYQGRYDNGLGRAVWFYAGGDPGKVAATIAAFPAERQADIWSGIGLACTYAGGVSEEQIWQLAELSGQYRAYLGQGCFLAAHTRHRAGNPREDSSTELILTGHDSAACHREGLAIRERLLGKREVDGRPSFLLLLEQVRAFLTPPPVRSRIVCYGTIVHEL